tara:strand:- start:80 stop:1189 length:1110 start_codon:yes stop_codon:yes gene_type:complete
MNNKIEIESKLRFPFKASEINRANKTLEAYGSLETALVSSKFSEVRPNAIHIRQYLKRALPAKLTGLDLDGYAISFTIGRKVKSNSCKIINVDKTQKVLTIGVAQLQTSYSKLPAVVSLIKALLTAFFQGVEYTTNEGEKKTFKGRLDLPSGADQSKNRNSLILNELGISEFSGMSTSAILTSFRCTRCNYKYVACNAPERDRACTIPNCTGSLKATRLNYNHRSDNLKKHWGVSKETVLMGLNPHDPAIKFSTGKVRSLVFEYMNWEDSKEVTKEDLDQARIESQGVTKGEAKLIVNTLNRADRVLKFKEYLDTLDKKILKGANVTRSKLHKLKKSEVIKLLDFLKIKYDKDLSGSDLAMFIINSKNG